MIREGGFCGGHPVGSWPQHTKRDEYEEVYTMERTIDGEALIVGARTHTLIHRSFIIASALHLPLNNRYRNPPFLQTYLRFLEKFISFAALF